MTQTVRRKKFVDGRVQGALAWRLFCQWFLFVAIAGVSAFILQFSCNPLLPPGEHFQNLWMTYVPLLLSMVFLLPVFIFDTIKLSHRFAGPVLRLRNEMRAVADGGELRRLSFRKGDFWHSLAEDYNALLDRFETDKEVTVYNETVVDEVAEPVCSV
jgi:hypothetical protein